MTNAYFNADGSPGSLSRGRSDVMRSEFTRLEQAFDAVTASLALKAPLASPAFTGSASFAGPVVFNGSGDASGASLFKVPTIISPADNTTNAASTAFVQSAIGASGTLLPPQAGHTDEYLQTNGSSYAWARLKLQRLALAGNTTLGAAKSATQVDCTGTFTLTLDTPANLGAGWYAIVRNAGSGVVTIAATSGVIDGLASYVCLPGEARLFQCDGAVIGSVVLNPFAVKRYLAGSTLAMPPGYTRIGYDMVGGGAGGSSGARNTSTQGGPGGGGGGRVFGTVTAPAAGTTITVNVGAGGPGAPGLTVDGTAAAGTNGGASSLVWSAVTQAQVQGGTSVSQAGGAGQGGGIVSGHVNGGGGNFASGFSGGKGGVLVTNAAEWGGGSGGYTQSSSGQPGVAGGSSVFGGPGGGSGGWVDGATNRAGGAGGTLASYAAGGGGAGGTAGGGAGGTAANSGGGGGGGNNAGAGGAGGAGTGFGAGGGGGGGVSGAFTSGAGGNGADGRVDIWGVI